MSLLIETILWKSWEHIELAFSSIFFSIFLAVPLGIYLAKKQKNTLLRKFVMRGCSIVQTIPGLALIALIIAILEIVGTIVHLPTTGFLPAIIVLIAYAFFPILNAVYTGIKEVPFSMVEVAIAMGMKERERLLWVEIPHALPLIISGIRFSFVYTVGMITLTSLVGSGGLGDLILQGLRSMNITYILAGTIPTALLALFFDTLFEKLGIILMPWKRTPL